MYRPKPFVVDAPDALHAVIRARVFATLALIDKERVRFAYAPVVLDVEDGHGTIRFHLARANPVAALADGARLAVSFTGPDAYISPDWYASDAMVPTWNYIVVEGEGVARKLEPQALLQLLADLSAQEEAGLLPKPPWTLDKVPAPRLDALLNAIEGFALAFDRLEGKFKLSQDKRPADLDGVLAGLEARGDAASLAVAAAMRAQSEGEDT